MISKKLAPDVIRGGYRFSKKDHAPPISTPPERKCIMVTPTRFACIVSVCLAVASFAGGANAQDAKHGQQVFTACAACHATDNTTRLGPGLQGIVGRRS